MSAQGQVGTLRKVHRNSLLDDARKDWRLYVMLLLPVAYIIIFAYVPMGGVSIAFKDFRIKKDVWGSPWVGLQHFENFFNTPNFPMLLCNTLILSVYSLLASFPFPILLALAINECRSRRYRKFVQMTTYAPYFISTVVLVGIEQ